MSTYKKLRTPIIKPRSQGGTFYTFSSAMEDIGLNVNELKNKVALSHYVLLNIPAFDSSTTYGSSNDNLNQGDYAFAEMFENYALNMESVLRNQPTYNFAESLSVSERTFWKFMKKFGFAHFSVDAQNSSYYVEDSSLVKGYGLITAGAQRTDEYGIYNETFVQIPSSYGLMKTLFIPVPDKNYHITHSESDYFLSDSSTGYIENVSLDEVVNGKLHTGISANAIYDASAGRGYVVTGEDDELCVDFSLDNLREYFGNSTLSYDDIAMQGLGLDDIIKDSPYTFNAILLYYSIYDSTTKNILATNAYGLMLLESANADEGSDNSYVYPSIEKRKTTTAHSGNSYSFRLNVKTSSVYSGDTVVHDNSTAAYEMSTEFNDVIRNLSAAVETLRSNANVIAKISNDNTSIKHFALQSISKMDDLKKDIALIKSGKTSTVNTDVLTAMDATVKSLIASTTLYDASGNTVGEFTGDTFKYKNAEFDLVNVDKVVGDVETTVIAAGPENTINVTNNAQTTNYAAFDANGVHSNKDITYLNDQSVYSDSIAISSNEAETFFDNACVGYDNADGFVIKMNDTTTSNALINAAVSANCSIAGLLALIIAKVKTFGNVANLEATAAAATSSADAAVSIANSAASSANTALETANSAASSSNTALETANNAASSADAATTSVAALADSKADITSLPAQIFDASALTNPYASGLTSRRLGDVAVNTTSLEVWIANANTASAVSWQIASQGKYGGTLITDVHSITSNGFYSAVSTAANLPTNAESFYIQAMCSNLSTTSAILTAIGLTTGKMYMQRKVSGTWGSWVGGITQAELAYLSGVSSNVQGQFDRITRDFGRYSSTVEQTLSVAVSGKYVDRDSALEVSNASYAISNPITLAAGDLLLIPSASAVLASVALVSKKISNTTQKAVIYTYAYDAYERISTATADYNSAVYTAHYVDDNAVTPDYWILGSDHIASLPATHDVTDSHYVPSIKQSVAGMPDTGYYAYLSDVAQDVVVSALTATVNGGKVIKAGWGLAKNLSTNFVGADRQAVIAEALCTLSATVSGIEDKLNNGMSRLKVDHLFVGRELSGLNVSGSFCLTGAGVPSSSVVPTNYDAATYGDWLGIPQFVGQEYLDTTNNIFYKAKGVNAIADWLRISNV